MFFIGALLGLFAGYWFGQSEHKIAIAARTFISRWWPRDPGGADGL